MMNVRDLKNSVNSIHMKDEMRKSVIENVDQRVCRSENGKNDAAAMHTVWRSAGWHKATAAAAILIVMSAVIAFPVRALVNSLVRERLESMPEEEVESIIDDEKSIRAAANDYSREYTDSENARYRDLLEKYQAGTFPEKEIPKVDSKEDVKTDELCFVVPDSTFYLPERELTDEEILEIIDFDVKRNYALEQNYNREHAEEIAQMAEEQKELIADNVAEGGITEQQAVEIAVGKLYDIYGSRGEGMEMRCRYNESSISGMGNPCYSINWSNEVTHKTYYIDISAQDGRVLWTRQTDPDFSMDVPDITIEEAEGKIVTLQNQAEEFMQKMEISYENVYVYYLESAAGIAYREGVRFVFETSGQSAYGITYQWNGVMRTYEEVNFADYQERNGEIRVMSIRGEKVEMKQIFQKMSEK
ncbi:MAG: hypothetical protein K2J99_07570 [Lachnospiraceae bacterium]|nr:hypothetical protein [Lachnospiraceae bacterium]